MNSTKVLKTILTFMLCVHCRGYIIQEATVVESGTIAESATVEESDTDADTSYPDRAALPQCANDFCGRLR